MLTQQLLYFTPVSAQKPGFATPECDVAAELLKFDVLLSP